MGIPNVTVQPKQSTTAQRNNIKPHSTTIARGNSQSKDKFTQYRPRHALIKPYGISVAQKNANRVPTQLARSEFSTSPRTSSAKLVVMPQDGQGFPVHTLNVHGGKPSWV